MIFQPLRSWLISGVPLGQVRTKLHEGEVRKIILVGQQHLILNFKQHLQGFRPWVSALGWVNVQPVIHLTPVRGCAAHYQTAQHFGFLAALLGAQLYQRSKRAGFWLGEFHNELNFPPPAGVVNSIIYYFNASAALPHFMPGAQISKHPAVSSRRLWDFLQGVFVILDGVRSLQVCQTLNEKAES
jgi:hypothetical protein